MSVTVSIHARFMCDGLHIMTSHYALRVRPSTRAAPQNNASCALGLWLCSSHLELTRAESLAILTHKSMSGSGITSGSVPSGDDSGEDAMTLGGHTLGSQDPAPSDDVSGGPIPSTAVDTAFDQQEDDPDYAHYMSGTSIGLSVSPEGCFAGFSMC